jgi:hypothetical protein
MLTLNFIPIARFVTPVGDSSTTGSKFITSFPGRGELMFWKTYSPYVVDVTFDTTTLQVQMALPQEYSSPPNSNKTQGTTANK